ncbi:DUF4357 domain-containing protein [Pseudophaeobacter sp.]|uniref:DUF4357 domain-containing protein n=1 Tax=Pseudophaeobacter sp. TaxID=1971739 RepID=UPI0032992FEE
MTMSDTFGHTIQLFLVDGKPWSFSSPSATAAVVLDRNSNGRIEWKVKGSRQTYHDWQQAQAAKKEAAS